MEDEIDLQKYILLLINHWKWIAGASIVLALVAMVISLYVLSPTYEAKALILIIPPRYSLTFDPKFQTDSSPDLLYYRPVAQLAESDSTFQALYSAWLTEGGDTSLTLQAIDGMTKVEFDNVTSSLQLIVTSSDAEAAAKLVNLWATVMVKKANDLFDNTQESAGTLTDQFAQIQAERETAQQTLVEYEGQNEATLLTVRLSVQQTTYSQLLTDQAKLTGVLQDIETLQAQISDLPANQVVSFDTELTALLLQLKAFNLDTTLTQVQIDAQPAETPRTGRELTTHLEQLHTVLTAKKDTLTLQLAPLQTEMLSLQAQIKEKVTTQERLQQNYQIASDTYITLARKLKETEISSEVSGSIVKLASQSKIPTEPVGPRTMVNTLFAGVFGGIMSVFGIFAKDFWGNLPEDQRPVRKNTSKVIKT